MRVLGWSSATSALPTRTQSSPRSSPGSSPRVRPWSWSWRPATTTSVSAQVAGGLFLVTGLLVLVSTLLPSASVGGRDVLVIRGVNVVAVGGGLLMLALRHRHAAWLPHVAVPLGLVLITVALNASGGGPQAVAFACVYLLAPVYSFFLLSRRAALPHFVLALALGVPTLAAQRDVGAAEQVVLWGVASMLGAAIAWMGHLVEEAERDPLTGLLNRRGLERAVDRLSLSGHRDVVAAVVDVDRFREYNEDRGRSAGDRFLISSVSAWRPVLPAGAVLARLGGDDFAVVLPDGDAEAAEDLCDGLRLRTPDGATLSAGVATREAGEAPLALLARAEAALQSAKATGRGGTYRHPGSAGDDGGVLDALAAGEFSVHYQPVVDAVSGRTVGAEALVRWNHPERGQVRPDAFIPDAERAGVIGAIGDFVLREACRTAATWPVPAGHPLYVAVNASAMELQDPTYAATVEAALRESGLPPERFVLELVESHYDIESLTVVGNLHRLRALGVRTAMDDFGVGYSSMGRLRQAAVDILKIDKSFISDITTEDAESPFLSAMLAMGRALGLRVVVEGVETAEQLRWITRHGGALIQGWHFGRPTPTLQLQDCDREAIAEGIAGIAQGIAEGIAQGQAGEHREVPPPRSPLPARSPVVP